MIAEIKNRRSVRKYRNAAVDDGLILKMIEAAQMAPSGNNTQPWDFVIVRSEETKEKIVVADHDQMWMLTAPVFIVCVADVRYRTNNHDQLVLDEESAFPELKMVIRDTSIAITHLLLEAEALGLSTCWTGWYDQKDMKPILGIPGDKYVCGVVTVGYGDEQPQARPRRELTEMIRYEKW